MQGEVRFGKACKGESLHSIFAPSVYYAHFAVHYGDPAEMQWLSDSETRMFQHRSARCDSSLPKDALCVAPRNKEREVRMLEDDVAVWMPSNLYDAVRRTSEGVEGVTRVPGHALSIDSAQHLSFTSHKTVSFVCHCTTP